MSRRLDASEITRQLTELPDWQHVTTTLRSTFVAPDFPAAARLVALAADEAEQMDHHPDIDLRWTTVRFGLTTHSADGLTQLDIELAHRISAAARTVAARADHDAARTVRLAVDTRDPAALTPFWEVALGQPVEDLDAEGHLALPGPGGDTVWFQQTDTPATGRNRLHLDVEVALDHAEALRERLIGAGGRLVTDEFAPHWWVIADADGNEVCICTPGT